MVDIPELKFSTSKWLRKANLKILFSFKWRILSFLSSLKEVYTLSHLLFFLMKTSRLILRPIFWTISLLDEFLYHWKVWIEIWCLRIIPEGCLMFCCSFKKKKWRSSLSIPRFKLSINWVNLLINSWFSLKWEIPLYLLYSCLYSLNSFIFFFFWKFPLYYINILYYIINIIIIIIIIRYY